MKIIKVSENSSRPMAIPIVRKGLYAGNPDQRWVKDNGVYRPLDNIVAPEPHCRLARS